MRFATALILALACLSGTASGQAARERKNILLVVGDDLGLDLGCYGSKVATPNLDQLAERGTRFTHAFATVASCSASRAVLLTGLYSHQNGQYGHAHPPNNFHTLDTVRSLPKILREAGYRTGSIGKLHVRPQPVYPFEVEQPPASVDVLTDQARQFIAKDDDRPFFLWFGFDEPHRILPAGHFGNSEAPKSFPVQRYDPNQVDLPYFMPDRPAARQELAEYQQAVSRMDHGVGLILQALREAKKDENTLVIFLSDNGIPFPGAKTTQYDSGLRLPLLVSTPGQKRPGKTNSAMVSWVDIAPTALDWAGQKSPAEMPGRSILPILDEEEPKGWDVVYGSHIFHELKTYYPMRTIRTRTHKLIVNLACTLPYPFASDLYGSKTWKDILSHRVPMLGERSVEAYVYRPREELYELQQDPNELANVVGGTDRAPVLEDLRVRLKEWQARTKDPWLTKYTYE